MLTDIFAKRYPDAVIWPAYTKAEVRLLVQSMGLIKDLTPYPDERRKVSAEIRDYWTDIEARLSRELGMLSLAPKFQGGFAIDPDQICERWAFSATGIEDPNEYMKERLSLVELALRKRGEWVASANARLDSDIADYLNRMKYSGTPRIRVPGERPGHWMRQANAKLNKVFNDAVAELNLRFVEARVKLHYHNGFIQFSQDVRLTQELEEPFWQLVSDKKWENVDRDMKEAIDLRDNGGRNPAKYAADALESVIKIISQNSGWTSGKERGASNYIENLAKDERYIASWEADILKQFFIKVRNPLGHGPGPEAIPSLSPSQTNWAIQSSMAWITSLITRNGGP